MSVLFINHRIAIPESELEERFIRSQGPGGQNVNKVASAVQLRFDVRASASLTEAARDALLERTGPTRAPGWWRSCAARRSPGGCDAPPRFLRPAGACGLKARSIAPASSRPARAPRRTERRHDPCTDRPSCYGSVAFGGMMTG
jgi:hypothetical protein